MSTVGVTADRIRGCLLAGAVGDALGAPVEFLSLAEITHRYGPAGIVDFVPAYGRTGAITDDTQMTLFTGEGMIRAKYRFIERGTTMPVTLLHRAYLRWFEMQGGSPTTNSFRLLGMDHQSKDINLNHGWLASIEALGASRAPGNTCLLSLEKTEGGTPDTPINDSKGCGGVMRVAPIGLAFTDDPSYAFELGCQAAALTHGHPSGYLAAGAMACLISQVSVNISMQTALESVLEQLQLRERAGEVITAIQQAIEAGAQQPPSADVIERLGSGWVAEEALAIALYCVIVSDSLEEAIILAVNHGGDSDSTGSIVGNIIGAMDGTVTIPDRWLSQVELRDEIETVADDLWKAFHYKGYEPSGSDYERYPPN